MKHGVEEFALLAVHLRINDASTGRPTPVRLRLSGPADEPFAPFGRHTEFAIAPHEDVGGHLRVDREAWCYIDGACEVRLPAGVPIRVQATKGPEYLPLDTTVILGPGQMALRFTMTHWSDARAAGWVPGDARVHAISPHTAALEAAAEDVSIVNLLVQAARSSSLDGTAYATLTNMTAFSGQAAALEAHGSLVAVNTLNVHPVLGSVGLLHAHRAVFPISFGGPDATDDWSVCDWCDQCHRKGGLTVWVNPFDPTTGVPGGEALVALILGKIDGLEYDGRPRVQPLLPAWYGLLNAGFRVPLVGSSGKDSNRTALGAVRTYAKLPAGAPPTYGAWIEAVRAGKTVVSTGPLLRFEVDGASPGQSLVAGGEPHHVSATVESLVPFDRLDLVANGRAIASAAPIAKEGRWAAQVEFDHATSESGWLAARCTGPTAFAHSAPIVLVAADGRPITRHPGSLAQLARAVTRTRDWIDTHGRFADERNRQHLLDLCDAATAKLETAD